MKDKVFFIVGSLVVVIVVAAMWLFSRRQGKDDNGSRYHVPDSGTGNSGTGNSGPGNSGPGTVEVLGGGSAADGDSDDGDPGFGDDPGTGDDDAVRPSSGSPRSTLSGFRSSPRPSGFGDSGFGEKREIMGGR